MRLAFSPTAASCAAGGSGSGWDAAGAERCTAAGSRPSSNATARRARRSASEDARCWTTPPIAWRASAPRLRCEKSCAETDADLSTLLVPGRAAKSPAIEVDFAARRVRGAVERCGFALTGETDDRPRRWAKVLRPLTADRRSCRGSPAGRPRLRRSRQSARRPATPGPAS